MLEIATAAILSCQEARHIINRMDSTKFTRRQYWDLVHTIKEQAPARCNIHAQPTIFKGQLRRVRQARRPQRVVVHPVFIWRF